MWMLNEKEMQEFEDGKYQQQNNKRINLSSKMAEDSPHPSGSCKYYQ